VPTLVDMHNPGLTGGVQNQPDFQAGAVDYRTYFASEEPVAEFAIGSPSHNIYCLSGANDRYMLR
jgi:hypothetical protein